MEAIQQYIQPELLITVPLLYLIGTQLKRHKKFPDSKIPITLGAISIALSILYTFSTVPLSNVQEVLGALFTALTQGALCAATSVYTHQLIKQSRESDTGAPPEEPVPPPSGPAKPNTP